MSHPRIAFVPSYRFLDCFVLGIKQLFPPLPFMSNERLDERLNDKTNSDKIRKQSSCSLHDEMWSKDEFVIDPVMQTGATARSSCAETNQVTPFITFRSYARRGNGRKVLLMIHPGIWLWNLFLFCQLGVFKTRHCLEFVTPKEAFLPCAAFRQLFSGINILPVAET